MLNQLEAQYNAALYARLEMLEYLVANLLAALIEGQGLSRDEIEESLQSLRLTYASAAVNRGAFDAETTERFYAALKNNDNPFDTL